MINAYLKLHEKFIDLVSNYYNLHLRFTKHPTVHSSENVAVPMREIRELMLEMEELVSKINKELIDDKRIRLDTNKRNRNDNSRTDENAI